MKIFSLQIFIILSKLRTKEKLSLAEINIKLDDTKSLKIDMIRAPIYAVQSPTFHASPKPPEKSPEFLVIKLKRFFAVNFI